MSLRTKKSVRVRFSGTFFSLGAACRRSFSLSCAPGLICFLFILFSYCFLLHFPSKQFENDDEISGEADGSFDADDMDADDDNGDDGGHMMLSDMLDDEDVVTDGAHDDFLKNLRKIGAGSGNTKKRKLADLYQNRSENSFDVCFPLQYLSKAS